MFLKFKRAYDDDLVCLLIDATKIKDKSFCLDPNSWSKELHQIITVYTLENISKDTIINYVELNQDKSLEENVKLIKNLIKNDRKH